MVGEAWCQSGRIFQNFPKRPGANPDKFGKIFETARSNIRTEILSQNLARSAIRTLIRPSWCTGSARLVRVAKSMSLSKHFVLNVYLKFYFQFYDNQLLTSIWYSPAWALDNSVLLQCQLSQQSFKPTNIYCFHHSILWHSSTTRNPSSNGALFLSSQLWIWTEFAPCRMQLVTVTSSIQAIEETRQKLGWWWCPWRLLIGKYWVDKSFLFTVGVGP